MGKSVWTVILPRSNDDLTFVCESKKAANKLCEKINDHLWVRGMPRDCEVKKFESVKVKDIAIDKYIRFEILIEPYLEKEEGFPLNFANVEFAPKGIDLNKPEISRLEFDLLYDGSPVLVFSMEITDRLLKSEHPENEARRKYNRVMAQFTKSLKGQTIEDINKMPDQYKIHVPHSLIRDGKLIVFTSEKTKKAWMEQTGFSELDEDDFE